MRGTCVRKDRPADGRNRYERVYVLRTMPETRMLEPNRHGESAMEIAWAPICG
jgi:hypothetical protein